MHYIYTQPQNERFIKILIWSVCVQSKTASSLSPVCEHSLCAKQRHCDMLPQGLSLETELSGKLDHKL